MADQFSNLLTRLEAATARLESLGKTGNHQSNADSNAVLKAFDNIVDSEPFTTFVHLGDVIGGVVKDQQRNLIQIASQSKKPDQSKLAQVIAPLQKALEKVGQIKDKNRPSPFYSHLTCIADGIPALGWVVVEPAPGPYVNEMKDAAQFYANRVIKEYKDKDKNHVEFVNKYLEFLGELFKYVKTHHTTGLVWNPKGGDATTVTASSAPTQETSNKSGGNLMAELSGDVTARLKKVEKSEMTHKNPELRASSVVPASSAPNKQVKAAAVPSKPPKLALEGNKWVVENQSNNPSVVIQGAEIRHVAYIYNCQNSTITINGKINAVTLDNCKKVGLLIDTVVSTIDVVNCKSVQLQITGTAPTCCVDKTDGFQLYLSKEALGIEVLSAKSSEMNILIPNEQGEYTEAPVSEQFKTIIRDGKLITEALEHKE